MPKSVEDPIWLTEPKYCQRLGCEIQIIPTYYMAPSRWRSERVRFCSRRCVSIDTHRGKKRGPMSVEGRANISKAKKRRGEWAGPDNPNYGGQQNRGRVISAEHKKLLSERMINGGAAIARRAQGGKRSSLEIAIEQVLIANSLSFIPQHLIGNHCVDFFIPPNLVIECDGDYWHSLPEQQKRDDYNDAIIIGLGYNILRLGEQDIKNRLGFCEKAILERSVNCESAAS